VKLTVLIQIISYSRDFLAPLLLSLDCSNGHVVKALDDVHYIIVIVDVQNNMGQNATIYL
jgi:hypothetical protein